jgi:hypothetical protein
MGKFELLLPKKQAEWLAAASVNPPPEIWIVPPPARERGTYQVFENEFGVHTPAKFAPAFALNP